MNYYLKVLRTFNFNGRARRAEYWWFFLFNLIVSIILSAVGFMTNLTWSPTGAAPSDAMMTYGAAAPISIPSLVYGLATLVQNLAVGVRRLHDRNMTGWWLLLVLIPFCGSIVSQAVPSLMIALLMGLAMLVGVIILLVIFVMPGTAGANKYGEDPKAGGAAAPAAA